MKRRRLVLAAVSILITLPAAFGMFAAISFAARNRSNGTIVSSGIEREYLLYVPKSYDRTRPAPLVISMHGGGGWPVLQRDISLWNRVADEQGFLVVYPAGYTNSGVRAWRVSRGPGLARDVRFISDLIDELQSKYNIDPARIYANGLSNGGAMSFVLSCTLSNRIAAIGMVGAAHSLPWRWCTDTRPVPVINFHGTEDPVVPYHGGERWVAPIAFPDVERWTDNWARRNRCASQPADSSFATDVTRREYVNCANDASVVLFTIRGGGHTWPGGQQLPDWFMGKTSTSVHASREMWAFFRAHPLKR